MVRLVCAKYQISYQLVGRQPPRDSCGLCSASARQQAYSAHTYGNAHQQSGSQRSARHEWAIIIGIITRDPPAILRLASISAVLALLEKGIVATTARGGLA